MPSLRMRLVLGLTLLTVAGLPAVHAESIFSREAIGRWIEPYDVRAEGMGGVAIAVRDSFPHSQLNPAGYGFAIRSTGSFGLYPEARWIRGAGDESDCPDGIDCGGGTIRQNTARLRSVHGVIIIGRAWRLGFGIRQLNDPGYVQEARINTGRDDEAIRTEEGMGGFQEYTVAGAWRPSPTLAIGIEGLLVSGAIKDIVRFDFSSSAFEDTRDELTTRVKNALGIRLGGLWAVGRFSVGGFYQTAINEDDARVSWRNTNGFQAKESREISFPSALGFGAVWDIGQRWRAGANVVLRSWSDADLGPSIVLKDTRRFGAGFERTGAVSNQARFGQGVSWRFGISYDPWYFEDANGNRVREIAASVGMGLPVSRDRGVIDLLARLGRRTLEDTDRPEETFLLLGIGIRQGSMPRAF